LAEPRQGLNRLADVLHLTKVAPHATRPVALGIVNFRVCRGTIEFLKNFLIREMRVFSDGQVTRAVVGIPGSGLATPLADDDPCWAQTGPFRTSVTIILFMSARAAGSMNFCSVNESA
jgi:hypothetical protein